MINLSYIIPVNQYEFFQQIIPILSVYGFNVELNSISNTTDVILAGILPITHEWIPKILASRKTYVLWHWDLYSFTNYNQLHWQQFISMLYTASDIWSCGYEVARQLKEKLELDSYVIPAWINNEELANNQYTHYPCNVGPFAFYAASSDSFGKRLNWAERACDMLSYNLIVTRNQLMPRHEYVYALQNCKIYLCTAFEESNGTIPAMEAAACGKPIVVADIPASREVFGNTDVCYFNNWNFESLLETLKSAWVMEIGTKLRTRIIRNYDLQVIAKRIANRLKVVYANI